MALASSFGWLGFCLPEKFLHDPGRPSLKRSLNSKVPGPIGVQAPHTGPRPHRHQNPANALRPSVRGLFRPRLPNAPPLRTPSCKPPESPPPASKLQVGALPIGCSSMRFLLRLDYVHAVFHVPGSRNKNLNQLGLEVATQTSEMRSIPPFSLFPPVQIQAQRVTAPRRASGRRCGSRRLPRAGRPLLHPN